MSTPIDIVVKRTASNGPVRKGISKQIQRQKANSPFFQSLQNFNFSFDKKKLQPVVAPIAGFSAAFTEIFVLFPTEYCKVQVQLNRGNNTFSITSHLKERGFRIYKALPPMLIGAPLQGLLRFSCLDAVQKSPLLKSIDSPTLSGLIAGITAGVVESVLIVTPMETVKTKLIDSNKGLIDGVKYVVNKSGFKGLYSGLMPTIAKSASNQAIRFVVFSQYKAHVLKNTIEGQRLTSLQAMSGGILAGLVGCLLNTPIDTIKSRMQGIESTQYKGSMDCVVTMVKEEGIASLYKGLLMRSARVVPGQGIIFLVYEKVSTRLNNNFGL